MAFNLATPRQQVTLGRFGGIYTEADPRDLPPGASPLCHDCDFFIGGVTIRPGLRSAITTFTPFNPNPTSSFLYLKSTILQNPTSLSISPERVTFAESSDGIIWLELASESAGTMQAIITTILNSSRMLSESVGDVEFISLSNFIQGTDQPRTYSWTMIGRVSQVGPGAPPNIVSGGSSAISIAGITQGSAIALGAVQAVDGSGSAFFSVSPSSAPFSTNELVTLAGVADATFDAGSLQITACNTAGFDYLPPGYPDGVHVSSGGTVQSQLATVTTTIPHGLSPGASTTLAGTAGGVYDGTVTIFSVPTPTTFTFNAASIIGTVGAGGTTTAGTGHIAAGPRYAVCMFQMDNGYITPASPPVLFTTKDTDNFISVTNIPTGPPGTKARIIAITPANAGIGGPYYWIPNAPGIYDPTIVNDNTSTTLLEAAFSDAVLTSGINITVTGNNLLTGNQRELGEYVKATLFSGRVFYSGERTKVDNLPNLTFDGGQQNPSGQPQIICGWTKQSTFEQHISLATSPIYGQSLQFNNPTLSTINPTGTVYASLTDKIGQYNINIDPFGIATLQPNVTYAVRWTAWGDSVAVAGGASVRPMFVEDVSKIQHGPTLPTLTTTPTEFSGFVSVPTGILPVLDLELWPVNLVPLGNVYVDRIEIYPANEPTYGSQLIGSYLDNFQAVDAQTGPIDISFFTPNPITNHFRFLSSLYITSIDRTFSTTDNASSEPSGWQVNEISNTVGCLGPLASDVGEEYVLISDRHGVYLFDGGNHIKISQEIQQLWEQIYWPSANTVWIKNDLHQQRILVGVPMVTPNVFLPDAPANATPSTPNVILCCSTLGLANGADIAGAPGVHVSAFTGALLARDITRKWQAWYIASPVCQWINRVNGSEELWLGGTGTAKIYKLDATLTSDDGAAIAQRYVTYGFADEQSNTQFGLGFVRHLYEYLTLTAEGSGGLKVSTYPETFSAANPYIDTQPAVTLDNPAMDDINLPLNEIGNRIFLDFTTDGLLNSWFAIRRATIGATADQRIPVTGR